jgi:hypothetical protein
VLGALDARRGRHFGFGAFELMAARRGQIKRLSRIPRAFSVRAADGADEPRLGSFLRDTSATARLLASGDVGLLAIADGEVQATEWVRPGPADYDWDLERLGVVFRIPRGYCWLHNGNGASGVGPWAMVLGTLPRVLEERGIDVACLGVSCDNAYSVRCHESLGFRKVGRIVALRLGPLRFVRVRAEGERWVRFRESRLDLERLAI